MAQVRIMLAGGGSEGDVGDTSAWSYELYQSLILHPDTNGDDEFRLVILGMDPNSSSFLVQYFTWLGQQIGKQVTCFELPVLDRASADSAQTAATVEACDAIMIRGGDQGDYYDEWNDSLLEAAIRTVTGRGGSIGGTSAGAMSMAEFCFAGGRDLISSDVMLDSHSIYLDDVKGGSAIHPDFLGMIDAVTIDTHFTWRGRLGRLAGILAKSHEDFGRPDLTGIGIEEKTGIILEGNQLQIVGRGAVVMLRTTGLTRLIRQPGSPLIYTHLQLNRLVDDWEYDLAGGTVIAPPDAIALGSAGPTTNSGDLIIDGAVEADSTKFEWIAGYDPFAIQTSPVTPNQRESVGFCRGGNSDNRGYKQEALFHAVYTRPSLTALLLFEGGTALRMGPYPDLLYLDGARGGIIVETRPLAQGKLAFDFDSQNGVPHTAGLDRLQIHVVGDASNHKLFWHTEGLMLGVEPTPEGWSVLLQAWPSPSSPFDLTGDPRISVEDLTALANLID